MARSCPDLAALPLAQPAPDAEALIVSQRVGQALGLDLARLADLLGVARGAALLGEERLGVRLGAQRRGVPPWVSQRRCRQRVSGVQQALEILERRGAELACIGVHDSPLSSLDRGADGGDVLLAGLHTLLLEQLADLGVLGLVPVDAGDGGDRRGDVLDRVRGLPRPDVLEFLAHRSSFPSLRLAMRSRAVVLTSTEPPVWAS